MPLKVTRGATFKRLVSEGKVNPGTGRFTPGSGQGGSRQQYEQILAQQRQAREIAKAEKEAAALKEEELKIAEQKAAVATGPTETTAQKLTKQLTSTTPTLSDNLLKTITSKDTGIKLNLNEDLPIETDYSIYSTEQRATQQLLAEQETQAELNRLKQLQFEAEKEAGLKTESKATDILNPSALSNRQIFYGEEKQAQDQKKVDKLNKAIDEYNKEYEEFQQEFAKKDTDPTTPILDLSEEDYKAYNLRNEFFETKGRRLAKQQKDVENLFAARTTFQEELEKTDNLLLKAYFDPDTLQSGGIREGITEFQRIETEKEYAGTPSQRAFAGQPKNLLTAVLSTPQIYKEQYEQTGTTKLVNPLLAGTPQEKLYTLERPEYKNIFEGKEITDLAAPTTYEEELAFKRNIGLRAGLATARDPYDIQDLTEDLETFRTDALIGAGAGAAIGTIVPGIGTTIGATTGLLTGAIGGTVDVVTSNIVERQTGSEFLGKSLGTVSGIGAEIVSAGAVSKAVAKTISANPVLVGTPQSIAYELGADKLRVVRYSKFKTGTGFLTRKFDVIDDVIVKRSDLLENLTESQTKAIFKQATNPPKFLTDNIAKNRINFGNRTTDIDEYIGVFAKKSSKDIPLDELLAKLDVTEFEGIQRVSLRTGKDLVTKAKKAVKPTIYDDSIESVTGFGKVKEAEKAIRLKKGTKTFQFEGIGLSYSEADELVEGIAKTQKTAKTSAKKIKDLNLVGKRQYADLKEPEQIFELAPKQTSTSLQEDVIFIKGKQKGARLFTNQADDYSKFIAQTREKGFSQSIVYQGDDTLISPATKFKTDTLTFAGKKGKGQIIKTSVEGMPDEYLLKIASPTDDLTKSTKFTKIKVGKTGETIDDTLGLNMVGLDKGPDIKLLNEPMTTLSQDLEQAIIAYQKNATPKALKRVQELSTKIATMRLQTSITAASFTKSLKLNKEAAKLADEFAKSNKVLSLEDLKRIDAFSKSNKILSLEDLKRIDAFSKTGARLDKKSAKALADWEKKYGREPTDFRYETFGRGETTFLSDKSLEQYMKSLEKPKIKKLKPTKPSSDIVKKSGSGTLLMQRTKTLQDTLTKKATKTITDDKLLKTQKSSTATMVLEKTKSKTATATLTKTKPKTSTKTLAGQKQKSYTTSKEAVASTKTRTRNLFAQPRLSMVAQRNIASFKARQRIGAKAIAETKAETMTKELTDVAVEQDILSRTATRQATLVATATQTAVRTRAKQKTKLKTKLAQPTTGPLAPMPFIKAPPVKIPRLKLPVLPSPQPAKKQKTKLYKSQVRTDKNTKWKTVSKQLPRNKAYNEGLDTADNTVAQSVRVVYKKTVKKYVPDDPRIRDDKFRNKKYKSKVPGNPVKIEKRKHAIDTVGEKQGLSVAKYLKQKRNRLRLASPRQNKRFIKNKNVKLI